VCNGTSSKSAVRLPFCLIQKYAQFDNSGVYDEPLVASAKEAMAAIIARQPDDSSYDEILRELAYARMVQRGLEDSDAGPTVADDEIARRIDSWQK
jgi:predicted transcriptional regulator